MSESQNPWKLDRSGNLVYQLNDDGTNRITIRVEGGYESQPMGGRQEHDVKVSDKDVADLAKTIRALPDLIAILVEYVDNDTNRARVEWVTDFFDKELN